MLTIDVAAPSARERLHRGPDVGRADDYVPDAGGHAGRVGPDRLLRSLAEAVRLAREGEVVEIAATDCSGDVAARLSILEVVRFSVEELVRKVGVTIRKDIMGWR